MWISFSCWTLANIFYGHVIRYGNVFLAISGILEILTCIIWVIIKNPIPLEIIFDAKILTTSYGVSFYITLVGGMYYFYFIYS